MKRQFRFGLTLSWPRITTVFLIDVAVLALASHCPDAWQTHHIAWWVGIAIAAAVTIAGLLSHLGIPVASAPFARVRNWYADPHHVLTAGCAPSIDHRRRFSRDVVGVREYQGQLVTVIAVEGREVTQPGRHRHQEASSATLPVEAVAAWLRQFGVRLDSIDIVSVRTRRATEAAVPSVRGYYSEPGDAGSALDQRSTWLVLRMDPQRNVAAVAARDSLASPLAAATERLAQDLERRRCSTRILTADEIVDVDDAVLAGLEPAQIRPYWRYLRHRNGYVTSFWVSPKDITSEMLDQLWQPGTDAAVVTIRLTSRGGQPDVSAWVRYHSDKRLPRDVRSGLNRLTGRQLAAVGASLPAPAQRPQLTVPSRTLRDDEHIEVPVGAVPQYEMSSAAGAR
ncbi:MAG TPA: type VII secretion protein EccE [Mycobacterium sp.]|nr:type VII secretion protein EccE [Mycobacterium sp.]